MTKRNNMKKSIQIQHTILLIVIISTFIIVIGASYVTNKQMITELCNIDDSPLITPFQTGGALIKLLKINTIFNLVVGFILGITITQTAIYLKEVAKNNNNHKNKAKTIV